MTSAAPAASCSTCLHADMTRPNRRFCTLHDFVMPVTDYGELICTDWKAPPIHKGSLAIPAVTMWRDVLYVWKPSGMAPMAMLPFEEMQTLLLMLSVTLLDDPDTGWSLYLPVQSYEFLQPPGRYLTLHLDGSIVPFYVQDIEMLGESSRTGEASGESDGGTIQPAQRRVAKPENEHRVIVRLWIERHYDLRAIASQEKRRLTDPRWKGKSRALWVAGKLTGRPEIGYYALQPDSQFHASVEQKGI